jgi:Fur family ferric uptake transcriptional regulator
MRLLVLKILVEAGSAISLSDLEARFERADRSTLYRTLMTFEIYKNGELLQLLYTCVHL